MNSLYNAAIKYASMGWPIFPLIQRQKRPITKNGVLDATTDLNQIKEWWDEWPNANIGFACGVNGIYVIDVDYDDDKGINGYDSLKEFPALPETVKQLTPRGGFHAFFKTSNAPANRNSFRVGIDVRGNGYYVLLHPSIHPNGNKYIWANGLNPEEKELAEYPECMRPVIAVPCVSPVVGNTIHYTERNSSDVLNRASLYLAECEPAIQGYAGHDRLLYAACRLVHGFLLSDSDAYNLLASEYNPRCIPPWNLNNVSDEKDFRRKITEARKLQPQHSPGWLLNEESSVNLDIIDVESLLSKTIESKKEIILPEIQDNELEYLTKPTGLLGEICSWINSTAIKEQPFLSLACTLAFLGALFGRKIRDSMGSRTNLYCMGIATSSGGKAHAMNQIRRLCESAGCTDILGGDDIASDSAIEERVSKVEATLFLWDEIGYLLSHVKSGFDRHCAKVVSLLMKLYSAAGSIYKGREYAEVERQRTIIQPCCCIYGTSTMTRFAEGISPSELQDGWLSRCLVFCSHTNPNKTRGIEETPVPESISEKIRKWYLRRIDGDTDGHSLCQFVTSNFTRPAPRQLVVPITKDAEDVFCKFDEETIKFGRLNPSLACLWAKGEENAHRIALIVAAGENFDNPIIDYSIADYSCRLVKFLLTDFGKTIVPEIAGSIIENNKRKLINAINEKGISGASKMDVTSASRWTDKRNRDNLITDLIESGEIKLEQTKDGKSIRYWTTENYNKYIGK